MSKNFDDLVHQSIAVTLENMAFMEVLGQAEEVEATDEKCLTARLLVLDPLQAEMILTVPVELLRNIVDSVHAFPDDEVAEQIQYDMLGELLNTVAGRLLNDYLPGDQTYRLGLPEVSQDQPEVCDVARKTWRFSVEGSPLDLTIVGTEMLGEAEESN